MFQIDPQGLDAELSTSPVSNRRRQERTAAEIGAGLRQRGASGVSAQIIDLSVTGFRASTHLDLPNGSDVWLKLPGLEALHARVAWQNGYLVGCESAAKPL